MVVSFSLVVQKDVYIFIYPIDGDVFNVNFCYKTWVFFDMESHRNIHYFLPCLLPKIFFKYYFLESFYCSRDLCSSYLHGQHFPIIRIEKASQLNKPVHKTVLLIVFDHFIISAAPQVFVLTTDFIDNYDRFTPMSPIKM